MPHIQSINNGAFSPKRDDPRFRIRLYSASSTPGIGYFPWKRMGGEMLKDSSGTCLLYAVSPSYKMNNSSIEGTGRFLPAEHNTIGFFVAKLVKNG